MVEMKNSKSIIYVCVRILEFTVASLWKQFNKVLQLIRLQQVKLRDNIKLEVGEIIALDKNT